MKNKICVFLTFTFMLILLAFSVSAAGVVTITQNSLPFDGFVDMPLTFVAELSFSEAVPEGTDLSGITITSQNGTEYSLTATAGTVTNGTFQTATLIIPVLEQGSIHALSVPQIGNNEGSTTTFTTIGDNYLVKEEFNGYASCDWYTGTAVQTALIDTDGDGIEDAIKGAGNYHLNTVGGENIVLPKEGSFVISTRVKYEDGNSSDNYVLADGSLDAASGDTNNGGLFHFRMPSNYYFRGTTTSDGYLTYGGTNGKDVVTDYKIYANTWYDIYIVVSESRSAFKVIISDDKGNAYNGPYIANSYGGSPITAVGKLSYSYAWYVKATVKNLYLWENSALALPEATYKNARELDGAERIDPTDDLTVTITYDKAVTKQQIEKVVITNGAKLEKTLSEDRKTLTLNVTELDYEKEYAILSPRMGNNALREFKFSTGQTPPEGAFQTPYFDASTLIAGVPITATLEYEAYKETDLFVMMAFYDENKLMTHVSTAVLSTGKYGKEALKMTAVPLEGDVNVRFFVWDKYNNIRPLLPVTDM